MIETIIIILGFQGFLDALFLKWNVWNAIETFGSKSKHKFVYDLCFCHFCRSFHLCWMITILYATIWSFYWSLIIVPFVVSGITYLIRKQ